MSLSKRYLKTKPVCKVTFRIDADAAGATKEARLVGDFNDWNPEATPMKRLKTGGFTATLDLDAGKDYEFRYLMNGVAWENDWGADAYVPTAFGSENSLVRV